MIHKLLIANVLLVFMKKEAMRAVPCDPIGFCFLGEQCTMHPCEVKRELNHTLCDITDMMERLMKAQGVLTYDQEIKAHKDAEELACLKEMDAQKEAEDLAME